MAHLKSTDHNLVKAERDILLWKQNLILASFGKNTVGPARMIGAYKTMYFLFPKGIRLLFAFLICLPFFNFFIVFSGSSLSSVRSVLSKALDLI